MNRLAWWLGGGVIVIALLGGMTTCAYRRGVDAGSLDEDTKAIKAALAVSARAIEAGRRLRDSTRAAVAAADQAAAVAIADARAAHQREAVTRARIVITGDSAASIDSLPPVHVPEAIISELRAADTRHRLDSAAVVGLEKKVAARDADRAVADAQIAELVHNDSLHVENEGKLERAIVVTGKRKFWQGVKVGAGVTVTALAALAVVLKDE